ncbi:MAG: aquaporin family protein [Magnetococcales bacterium]|nr:aquaporin family protein [Magnetococcales bacterium]
MKNRHAALWAEAIGTAFLLVAVVGSGVMGEQLAQGNMGLALLANSLATGCGLYFLITVLGPVSGAHFNPLVSLRAFLLRDLTATLLSAYVAAQVVGGILGVWITHLMFDLPILQTSTKLRTGTGHWSGEVVATLGLILTIGLGERFKRDEIPLLVACYITSAYWFTSSTSFANPAVTLARALSDTFAGIAPVSVLGFVLAQTLGLALGMGVLWLLRPGQVAAKSH